MRVRYIVAALAMLLVAAGGFATFYLRTLQPRLKQRVVTALQQRFDADVQLKELQFSIFPSPSVEGAGLVITHKQWTGDPPLIQIRHFHAETDFTTILDWRNRVNSLTLEGLEIRVPPRGRATLKTNMEANQEVSSGEPGGDTTRLKFLIETIVADHALFEIEPKRAGKDPLRFSIEKLTMHSVGPGRAMTFTAQLQNALPPGAIQTSGHFGPWQRDDPRATPVSGDYTFKGADLSVFNGIGGTLSSEGEYGGVLQHIKVNGATDTPNFRLKQGGATVHLTTRFHSVVDGTNGDTILDPVDAKFGNSEFLCSGGIVQLAGHRGKTVSLEAHTKRARMEDILKLIVPGPPMVQGAVDFLSTIVIPPGKEQVADKLSLDGGFRLNSAVFTSQKAEERLRILSDRASGISKKQQAHEGIQGKVASNLYGKFMLNHGGISFSTLAFELPGARVQLAGKYNLNSLKVDMQGTFQMHATLSETQSGFKEIMLKPFDRMFEKNGSGFELPISVEGSRDHPVIGVSVFHKRFNIH